MPKKHNSLLLQPMTELFKIFRLHEDEAIKISNSPDEPHHHDFEELIIGLDGCLEHFIDFKSEVIDAPCISFVTRGKVHRAVPKLKNGRCDFWVLRFKSEFIPETTFQLYSLFHESANIPLLQGNCFSRLDTMCQMMSDELNQENTDYAIIRHLLSALFAMIDAERKKICPKEDLHQKTQSTTFQNFLSILEENYHRNEGVDFYADKLFMSARNLNVICRNIMQQSVSEIIETRKLIEAKNLLTQTEKSISEIGFELGYNEKAYFTNVFKKKSGQTPSEFRKEMKNLLVS
jgi:AraC family transcriptional regulator, transcriptional activator of pobA